MKRFLILLTLCLLACSCTAAGEETLYPIRVDGKWGYMNKVGEIIIEPQWMEANLFSGGVARVSMEESEKDGLIDPNGNIVVPLEYAVGERALSYAIYDSQYKVGYYDKASGFFLPPQYDFVFDQSPTSDPILVGWNDNENGAGNPELYGYLARDTGEVIIPFQYNALMEGCCFSEGYANPASICLNEDSILDDTLELYFLDVQGKEITFPDGISPAGSVHEGVLKITRHLTDDERESSHIGWGVIYGLAVPDGQILVWPQYDYVHDASDGCVCFLDNGLCGHMDLTGQIITPAKYRIAFGMNSLPEYEFHNGYAVLEDLNFSESEAGRWVVLDREGNEILLPVSCENKIKYMNFVFPNGLLWYFQDGFRGLVKIENGWASQLTGPIYEDYQMDYLYGDDFIFSSVEPFSEGLVAVKMNGLWGYINEDAEMVIPPTWDNAGGFYCGLAQVEKDGKLSYIDTAGTVIWQEP